MRVRQRLAAWEWQKSLALIACLALIAFIFLFQLTELLPGASANEVIAKNSSSSLREIINHPLNAPHKLLQYSFQKVGLDNLYAMRAVSVIFAGLLILCFYRLIRRWHSKRIAYITTGLFITSSSLLSIGRNATPTIMLSAWFFVVFLLLWFKHSHRVKLAPLILFAGLTALLYVPGSIYLIGLIAVWYFSRTPGFFRYMHKWPIFVGCLLAAVALAPLIVSFIRFPSHLGEWLMLPEHLTIGDFLNNLRNLATTAFYQSLPNPEFWLGRLPILDVFSGTMLILGLYAYRFYFKMERTPLLALVLILGVIVVGMAGVNFIYLLLPFMYIFIASGMAFLLEQWFRVFPRNPVARALGSILLSIAVLFTAYYHIYRYFVAWPNAPETKAVYSITQTQ